MPNVLIPNTLRNAAVMPLPRQRLASAKKNGLKKIKMLSFFTLTYFARIKYQILFHFHSPFTMKITFFSTQPYDKEFFVKHNEDFGYQLEFVDAGLDEKTAELVKKSEAVCVFVNDKVNREVIEALHRKG